MNPQHSTATHWLHLVQAEYLEMPGLNLTRPQIRRMWSLEREACDALIEHLLITRFLRRTAHDAYVLNSASPRS
jgi:hypothetical protein